MSTKSITLTFADGSTEVLPFAPGDLVRFERHYGIKVANGLRLDDLTAEMAMRLAWFAARRLKRTELEFDDWLDTITDTVSEPDPLAGSNGASPPSPPSVDSALTT